MARFVPELYVSSVDGSVSRESASIGMRRTKGWPREGTARIVGDDTVEIVHYTAISDDKAMIIPQSLDADTMTRGRGLLRGRFGTAIQSHETGDLILWQPSRYWNRYTPRRGPDGTAFAGVHDHPESAYLEFAKTVRNAQWRQVRWEYRPEDKTQQSKGTASSRSGRGAEKRNVIVVARFDQGVPWDSKSIVDLRGTRNSPPSDAKDDPKRYLYVFDTPEAANQLDFEADVAEFRVYFTYLPGAYLAQDFEDGGSLDTPAFVNDWKTTPKLQSFSVEYVNRTRVRYSAEIR